MSNVRFALATAVLTLALASPALAIPGEAPADRAYTTTFTPQYQVGSYAGVLKLVIAPDGIVSGEFRNEDTGSFTPVTGGLEAGQGIHLDFKWIGPVHINGRFDGNTIVGSTFFGGRVYDFAATPDLTQ